MFDPAPSPDRLRDLAGALERLRLPEPEADRRRRRALESARRLAARLDDPTGPITIVVAGPAGSGKSTIVDSLAGARITETGPVRPTTTTPVVWAGGVVPATLEPHVARTGEAEGSRRPPPDGVVVVDAPPPEVTDEAGRPVVDSLIALADAVLFVTGESRYADAEGFALLEEAAARGLPTVLVLNRLPVEPDVQQTMAEDFAAKLAGRRLIERADPELVVRVAEAPVSDSGLPAEDVAQVRKEIESMADPQARPDTVAAAVAGTLRLLRHDLAAVREAVIDAEVRRIGLLDPMRARYREQARLLVSEAMGGKLAGEELDGLIGALASAAARRAAIAARATAESWAATDPSLVRGAPGLFGHGSETLAAAHDHLAFWRSEVEALIDRLPTRRLRRRRRARVADHVVQATVDPRAAPSRSVARALARIPDVVQQARDALAGELRAILEADSRRFEARAGDAPPPGILADLTEVPAA